MYIDAGSTLHDHVTLTYDPLTSGSMHTDVAPWSICAPSLMLIARAVFLLQRGHTDIELYTKVSDATDHATYSSATAGVGSAMVMNLASPVMDSYSIKISVHPMSVRASIIPSIYGYKRNRNRFR